VLVLSLVLGACSSSGVGDAGEVTGGQPTTTAPTAGESESSSTRAPSTTTTTTTIPATTTTAVPTTTAPPDVWEGTDRVTVLLLGSDAGVGRTGTRTDTMILFSAAPATGDAVMISIPRNLTEAPLPEGMGIWDCDCFPDILTHLWANAEWYPDAFPGPQDPPVNALKAAFAGLFDIEIDHYAKVELAGFVGIFDALGGVTVEVPKRIVDESYPHELGGTEYVVIEEGTQHLDGHLALAYSRIRRHSGDFARMHRQRCVLGSLFDQTDATDVLAGLSDLAAAVQENVQTDIPLERLGDFVELLSRMEMDRFATLRVTRYNYGASGHAGYQLYDLERLRDDVHTLMADPTVHLDAQDGAGWQDTCTQSFD
jgi:LCP family protein required for cell wall assembly